MPPLPCASKNNTSTETTTSENISDEANTSASEFNPGNSTGHSTSNAPDSDLAGNSSGGGVGDVEAVGGVAVVGDGFGTTLQRTTITEPPQNIPDPLQSIADPLQSIPDPFQSVAEALEALQVLTQPDRAPDPDPDSDLAPDVAPEPDFVGGSGCGGEFAGGVVPVFDDPDYSSPNFQEPDPFIFQPPDSSTSPGIGMIPLNPPPPSPDIFGRHDAFRGVPLPRAVPVVLIPALSLLGLTNEPAWMEGIGPVSIDVAKLMTESAPSMYRLLVDPITNQAIEAGVDCYRISKSLRLMLQVRDEYCQFPGCYAKASTSDVDHIRAFAAGGKSTPTNLVHLCHLPLLGSSLEVGFLLCRVRSVRVGYRGGLYRL